MSKFYTESGKTLLFYNPTEILEKGLDYASRLKQRDVGQEAHAAAFRGFYGPKPDTVSEVWMEMQTTKIPEALIDVDLDKGVCLENLFMALYLAKSAPTYLELEIVLLKSSTSVSRWVKFFIRKIQALKAEKITWPENLGYDEDELDLITVSTFRCGVSQRHTRMNQNPDLYHSHALNGPAYVYEIARNTFDDRVVWMEGPFPGGLTKTGIFNVSGLCAKLEREPVLGLADNGYIDEPILWVPGPPTSPDHDWRRKLLAHHEMFFHEMRQCKILQEKYRHSEEMHKAFFEAIVVLSQMDLDSEPEV